MKEQMKTKWISRQGDVLIERIAKLPKELKRQEPVNGRIILAHGEATGHHHSIEADAADWWKDEAGEQFVTVHRETALVHQEHGPIKLAPGRYRGAQAEGISARGLKECGRLKNKHKRGTPCHRSLKPTQKPATTRADWTRLKSRGNCRFT
jgi:hypothetical protein